MAVRIVYHGHSNVEIHAGDGSAVHRIQLDPFYDNNPLADMKAAAVNPRTILVTHAHVDHIGPGLHRRRDQLAGAGRAGCHRVELPLADQGQPDGRGRLDDRAGAPPALLHQRERRLDRPPQRVRYAGRLQAGVERAGQHVKRALAPVGHRAQIDRVTARLQAPPNRLRHLGCGERALERVRRDEDAAGAGGQLLKRAGGGLGLAGGLAHPTHGALQRLVAAVQGLD